METILQGIAEEMYWYHGEVYGKKAVSQDQFAQGEQAEDDLKNQGKKNEQDGKGAT